MEMGGGRRMWSGSFVLTHLHCGVQEGHGEQQRLPLRQAADLQLVLSDAAERPLQTGLHP